MTTPRRSRRRLLSIALIIIAAGLLSRRGAMPPIIKAYAGDALWAMLVYVLLLTARPTIPPARAMAAAFAFAVAIEISQLYHAPWINAIRSTRLGGLVLGFGFLSSDLVCYAIGILISAVVDVGFGAKRLATDGAPMNTDVNQHR